MAMTINGQFSQGADNLTTIMNRHQTEMGKSLEKVSTGKKINHAGDDSSGNAISEKMLAQIRGLDQSQENTQSAYSLLKVADAAITSIVDIVRAMKTKALEAANDSLSAEDRLAVANEINQLKDQVASSALVTHNGRYLLNGDYGTISEAATYDTDSTDTTTTDSTDTDATTDSTDSSTSTSSSNHLSFSDFSWEGENHLYFQIGPNRNDGVITHLMNLTENYIFKDVTIDVSSVSAASKTARTLDKALTRALYQQTEIGSLQERLDFTSENLQLVSNETTNALSTIQDADMAKEMTNYVKNNVLMQATQAMMAQANTTLASFIDLIKPQ